TAIISTIYIGIFLEINHYFESLYKASELIIKDEDYNQYYNNYSLLKFKNIWLLIYSMVFVSILSLLNINKFKNRTLGFINIGMNCFVVFLFLSVGLYTLSELRGYYTNQNLSQYYHIG